MGMDALEGLRETGSEFVQLPRVIVRERAQQPLAPACEPQKHTAAIGRILRAPQQSLALRPVDQLNDAVVAQAEAPGCVRNGGGRGRGRTRYLQQELMLLGL